MCVDSAASPDMVDVGSYHCWLFDCCSRLRTAAISDAESLDSTSVQLQVAKEGQDWKGKPLGVRRGL